MTEEDKTIQQILLFKAELFFQQEKELQNTPEYKAYEEAKMNLENSDLYKKIQETESDIRQEVLLSGSTIKTEFGNITYISGGDVVKWDTSMLDGLAIVYPGIKNARHLEEKAPQVRITRSKEISQ